jgi:tricorn protease
MKYLLLVLVSWAYIHAPAQDADTWFATYPALTPDGNTVIFSYEGDLWKASVKDGQAVRLTAMQGYETNARVSPDGKWIAFTGRQMGNPDVYVMPADGGEIRQLTYHDATDEVEGWGWDSQTIYFTSGRYNAFSGYKVNVSGGTPVRLFWNYFNTVHNLAEAPDGQLFFSETWESKVFAQRKGYKGAYNPDIQSYNPKTKSFKKYTDYIGKDLWATIDKNGKIYFVSDESNGEYNLYTFDGDKKSRLTSFNTSIKRPFVAANGSRVVFERDYQLYLYDVASKNTTKLNIRAVRNNLLPQLQNFNINNTISYFDVAPDGKKMAFVSRGEIFVSDVEGKFIQQVKRGNAERVMELKWLSDNKTLLFNQTVEGYLNWFTIAADGSGSAKQLTNDKRNNRDIVLNKSRSKAVYISGRDEVRLLDCKTFESKLVARDEIWAIQNADPGFSPNDEYVFFTAKRNFEDDIFIHHLKTGKTTNLTNTGVTETAPFWSPDGKYIYFVSNRLRPGYPYGLQNARIYRMPLEKFDDAYRVDKFRELFRKDSTRKDSVITVDVANIMDRVERITPNFGTQSNPYVLQKGEKTLLLYNSDHMQGQAGLWKTTLDPFDPPKTDRIEGINFGGFQLVEAADKYYVLTAGTVYKLNLDLNRTDKIELNYTFRRNLAQEFDQIFDETWAGVEENFYDENFHGVNWKKLRDQYRQYVRHVNTRADLRLMLNDMLGELNSSHTGFNTFGDDESVRLTSATMETGIMYEDNEPYRVKYIVSKSNADRKGVDVRPGDVLVKVNGEPVDAKTDRNYYFNRPSLDRELVLTFNRAGQQVEVKLHPQSSSVLNNNLYDEWIETNRQRVNSKSNSRIAYGYMKNMGQPELENFLVDMTRQLTNRDALILDLRYNTGGNVHDDVLRFLSQKSYLQWKYREGQMTPQSNFSPSDKPIVLLVNEQSLSDAEMTATGFKHLKLGKIIGTETYRWIIFTSGKGLVDGSFYRLPSWGCYRLDGGNIEKEGVKPDITVVNTFLDRVNGNDPQLDKAIETILQDLKGQALKTK